MTTLVEFREQLRLDLDDATKKQWSDAELERYLKQSAAEYSRYFPRVREQEFIPDGVSSRFDVPEDLLDQGVTDIWVVDQGRVFEIPGDALELRAPERNYHVVDQEIQFNFVPLISNTIRVRYSAIHDIPATGAATVPTEDEELINLWAQMLAWRKIAGKDASLTRWKEQGARDDSPIIPYFLILRREYDKAIEKKLARGRVLVRRRPPRYARWGYELEF